jgi:ParB family chromosome partitioning protein
LSTKKRGLGRGLDSLLEKSDEPARSLPIDSLRPNRMQPRTRFNEAAIEELAESIRLQGIVQPLVVTPESDGTFAIIAGERRWRAARKAGLTEVPVSVRQVTDDRELLELALVENLQRSDLDPMEEAEAYQALQEKFSLSQDEVAARVGKARTTVANSLRLLRLPEEIRDMIAAGLLTAGQARPLLGLESVEAQIALARRATDEGLSARDLEREAAGAKEPAKKSAKTVKPIEVNTAAAAETLTRRLQTRVEILRRGKGGQLRVHFHSEDELMRLYDHLLGKGESR